MISHKYLVYFTFLHKGDQFQFRWIIQQFYLKGIVVSTNTEWWEMSFKIKETVGDTEYFRPLLSLIYYQICNFFYSCGHKYSVSYNFSYLQRGRDLQHIMYVKKKLPLNFHLMKSDSLEGKLQLLIIHFSLYTMVSTFPK